MLFLLYFCGMPKKIQIQLAPHQHEDQRLWRKRVARKLRVHPNQISHIELRRRSLDARKRNGISYQLQLEVWVDEAVEPGKPWQLQLQDVSKAEEVHVVGLGPAGLFAALKLIEQGLKPVVIERGKAVRDRRRDLAVLNREGIVNPESNYCFGEGGAGTFSDGKLYTRSKKRGDVRRVLDILVQFGATHEILIDNHPHIGTNRLPKIIQKMRETILECGGEVHFDTRLSGLNIQDGVLKGIEVNGSEKWPVKALILATGHSARDIFRLLQQARVEIHAKPFALGLRVEHPQALIDQIQYKCEGDRPDGLPASNYSLVQQVRGKGVYSFCMCPGGIICPAATSPDEVVVNGWSPALRNTGYANSGIVVELQLKDFMKADDPLSGMLFQQRVEQKAEVAGGGKQQAPATRLFDFVKGKASASLPDCSYLPGITPVDMQDVLPKFIRQRLQIGFEAFGHKLKGYLTNDAVVVGVESRTSSPVSIPRDEKTLEHPGVKGLFPCGEGAGYAGGIVSAAMDGERVGEAVKRRLGVESRE